MPFYTKLLPMNLVVDFKADWHDILRAIMVDDWGVDISGLDKDIPIHFFNSQQRRISSRSRRLLLADTFNCPPEHQVGWSRLRNKIVSGHNLSAHLSKLVDDASKTDLMLSDWGVHHFHLGTEVKSGYVNRTGPLLFARVTDHTFYGIGVYAHADWAEADVVETIHRNWPGTIEMWAMNGARAERKISTDERAVLRSKRCNAFVQVDDGTTYGPVGGGFVSSGHSIFAVIEMDKEHDLLECLERLLPEIIPQLVPELKLRGYEDASNLEVRLALTQLAYFAYLPQYAIATEILKRRPGPWNDVVSKAGVIRDVP